MIKDILTAAAVPFKQGRYIGPPAETYAVYFDDVEVNGADPVPTSVKLPRICTHDARIELYEPKPDDVAEAAIEAELNARGLPWTKEDRYWLKDAQRYQVLYEFTFYSKI